MSRLHGYIASTYLFSPSGEAAAEQLGPSCRFYPLDTSDPEAVLRFSATLHQELPGQQIELLVRL